MPLFSNEFTFVLKSEVFSLFEKCGFLETEKQKMQLEMDERVEKMKKEVGSPLVSGVIFTSSPLVSSVIFTSSPLVWSVI
jgi:hypothetical protein